MGADRKAGPPSYDRAASYYDRAHGRARSKRRFARIEAPILAATVGARRVLEVGVGTGRLLSQVDAPVRVGLDTSSAMLAEAHRRTGLLLLRAHAHELPFADASFDAVIAGKGVFRYLDADRAFAECARVLSPGGRLALHQYSADTWSLRWLLGARPPPETRRLHIERPGDLEQAAGRAGFLDHAVHLFRSVRVYPYALEIPRALAGRLWSHIVYVGRRAVESNTDRGAGN